MATTRKPAQRNTAAKARTAKSTGAAKRAPVKNASAAKRTSAKRAPAKKGGVRFKLKNPRKLLRLLPMLLIPALLITMLLLIKDAGVKELFTPAASPAAQQSAGSVRVEGIDVTGLSREQALAQLKPAATTLLASIDMLVKDGETELRLTSAFIEADTDLEEILDTIYTQGASGSLTLTVSASDAMLLERLASIRDAVGTPPVEPYAQARLNENNVQRFEVAEGKPGTVMDVEATAAAIQLRLAARDFQCTLAPVMKDVSPTMTTAFIEENTQRIATYTTRFRDSESVETIANRVFNIRKATEILNTCVVPPNEEFSFNGHVGLRTVDGGWKEANGITGGKEYSLQAGGGICQVSTTLYNALLRGNIEVTDRKAHSIPSDYVDKGLDATVDSAGIDLKFINDTGAPLYIFAYVKPDGERYSTVTVSLYGKPLPGGVTYECRSEVVETNERTDTRFTYSDKVPQGYELQTVSRHDGYTAEVYRDKYVNGSLEDSVLLYTDKYRGNVAEITVGTGDPATVSVPEGAKKCNDTSNEAG